MKPEGELTIENSEVNKMFRSVLLIHSIVQSTIEQYDMVEPAAFQHFVTVNSKLSTLLIHTTCKINYELFG